MFKTLAWALLMCMVFYLYAEGATQAISQGGRPLF